MSKVNEEFLETPEQQMIQVCTDIYYECKTIKKLDELTDKALAILQHFQQEQESKTSKRLVEWTKHLKKGEELFGRVDWDAALYGLKRRDKWSAGEESKMYTQSEVDRLIREAKIDTLKEAAYVLKKADIDSVDIENKMYLSYVDTIKYLFDYAKQQEGSR